MGKFKEAKKGKVWGGEVRKNDVSKVGKMEVGNAGWESRMSKEIRN